MKLIQIVLLCAILMICYTIIEVQGSFVKEEQQTTQTILANRILEDIINNDEREDNVNRAQPNHGDIPVLDHARPSSDSGRFGDRLRKFKNKIKEKAKKKFDKIKKKVKKIIKGFCGNHSQPGGPPPRKEALSEQIKWSSDSTFLFRRRRRRSSKKNFENDFLKKVFQIFKKLKIRRRRRRRRRSVQQDFHQPGGGVGPIRTDHLQKNTLSSEEDYTLSELI
mmetsp:Transcript_7763/g.11519  ORF Transcript_7763/g.11519 Transcript_7763/m.11519 type:complete len:222 (-) Transcript_7763:51-716(-)